MSNLFETLSTATRNQSDLINAGIEPSQATRIAFDAIKEATIEVDRMLLNEFFKIAFLSGDLHRKQAIEGTAKQTQGEAINNCIRTINQMIA